MTACCCSSHELPNHRRRQSKTYRIPATRRSHLLNKDKAFTKRRVPRHDEPFSRPQQPIAMYRKTSRHDGGDFQTSTNCHKLTRGATPRRTTTTQWIASAQNTQKTHDQPRVQNACHETVTTPTVQQPPTTRTATEMQRQTETSAQNTAGPTEMNMEKATSTKSTPSSRTMKKRAKHWKSHDEVHASSRVCLTYSGQQGTTGIFNIR